jgi:hypothetical protein
VCSRLYWSFPSYFMQPGVSHHCTQSAGYIKLLCIGGKTTLCRPGPLSNPPKMPNMRKISSLSTESPTVDYPKIKPEAPRYHAKTPSIRHLLSALQPRSISSRASVGSSVTMKTTPTKGPGVSYFYQPIIRTGIWLSAKLS